MLGAVDGRCIICGLAHLPDKGGYKMLSLTSGQDCSPISMQSEEEGEGEEEGEREGEEEKEQE